MQESMPEIKEAKENGNVSFHQEGMVVIKSDAPRDSVKPTLFTTLDLQMLLEGLTTI